MLEACLRQIATGKLVILSDSYGVTCPVERCQRILSSDAYAIKKIVPPEFYQLYLGVAALLSAKRPLSFALCKYCARKCALTWEGKLLCWRCSSPKRKQICQEKEGWLSKKGKEGWRRKYFVIRPDGNLSYTPKPPHLQSGGTEGGKGVTHLRQLASIRDLPNSSNLHVFSLVSNALPELVLGAESLREKQEWMEALSSWRPPG